MQTSYKPLVERYEIPRPTLIEWQKRVKESDNWRVKHLAYLRMQLSVEQETLQEIKQKAPCTEDLFLFSVYLFFHNHDDFVPKEMLLKGLRAFALETRSGVEYQHDFAHRIWSIRMVEESSKKMVNYYRLFDLLRNFTAAQYAVLFNLVLEFVNQTKQKYSIATTTFLSGKTWQELHTYDRAFSNKAVETFFSRKGIIDSIDDKNY